MYSCLEAKFRIPPLRGKSVFRIHLPSVSQRCQPPHKIQNTPLKYTNLPFFKSSFSKSWENSADEDSIFFFMFGLYASVAKSSYQGWPEWTKQDTKKEDLCKSACSFTLVTLRTHRFKRLINLF